MTTEILEPGEIVFVNHIFEYDFLLNRSLMAKDCHGIILDHEYQGAPNMLTPGFLYYSYFNFDTNKIEKIFYRNILKVL